LVITLELESVYHYPPIMANLFSVVVLTGGPSRPHLTSKCLDSINFQKYENIQKILINNGRPADQLLEISMFDPDPSVADNKNRLLDWEVLTLKDSTFDPLDYTSIWKVPGILAMTKVKGDYLFCINDDDYLDENFFLNMSISLSKYPDAISAFGLPLSYKVESGEVISPINGSWVDRPEYEDGIRVSYNWLKYDRSYHPNPGFSFVVKTEKVRQIQDMFFSGGFPDITALIQVVPFGKTIFNKSALMYLGRHGMQQRNDWDNENKYGITYKKGFADMLTINMQALHVLKNGNRKLEKLVKYFFAYNLVESSFYVFYDQFKNFLVRKDNSLTFRILYKHIEILLIHPIITIRIMLRELRNMRILKFFRSAKFN
jgi:hypothetical protein